MDELWASLATQKKKIDELQAGLLAQRKERARFATQKKELETKYQKQMD